MHASVHKTRVEKGDRKAALAVAIYLTEPSEGPLAYARKGEPEGAPQWGGTVWLGDKRAMDWLGLEGGEVQAEELASAVAGTHAVTGKQIRRPGRSWARDQHGNKLLDADGKPYKVLVVNSFDLTFSVPKSVSILWTQADAELRAELERAIVDAANGALEHIVRTRPVISGKDVGHGFVAAASLHVAARVAEGDPAPAPQLHLHTELVGALNAAGQLRTPESSALFKDNAMREMAALSQLLLARRIEQLGIPVISRTGKDGLYFEIAGVPQGLIERFSARHREILAWVEEIEARFGTRVSKRAAPSPPKATRRDKEPVPIADTYAWWDGSAEELEFRVGAIEAGRAGYRPSYDIAAVKEEVRNAVHVQLWKEGPTVSVGAVRAMAMQFSGARLAPEEVFELLREMQRSGELVMLEDDLVVSGQVRAGEEFVRDVSIGAANRGTAALKEKSVRRGIEAAERSLKNRLDPEQREAVELLTSGPDWACLTGRPGTGKGPVLEAVAEAHRAEGWKVVAVALDNATAQRLGKQVSGGGISFQSLRSRLRSRRAFDHRTLILIDEASKAGLKDWLTVAQACRDRGLRVIAVGDALQSGAIECAGMYDQMLATTPTATLAVVRRHRDPNDPGKVHPWLAPQSQARAEGREVAPGYHDHLYAGQGEKAIEVLREHDALHLHDSREEAMVALVDDWEKARREHGLEARETVLIVYGTNPEVDKVNVMAQRRRLRAGEIGGDSVRAVDRGYRFYVGDVVMLREAAFHPPPGKRGRQEPRVANGTMGTVVAVDRGREQVTVDFDSDGDEPRRVTMDLGELRRQWQNEQMLKDRGLPHRHVPSLRLSIAGHQFPMQGGTWYFAGSLWGDSRQKAEATISGDARAKALFVAHVDRPSLGREGTDEDRLRRKGVELSKLAHKSSSLTRELDPNGGIGQLMHEYAHDYEIGRAGERQRERAQDHKQWRDPLRHHREALGAHRVDMVELRAEELATEVAGRDVEWLEAALERAEISIERFDMQAHYETQRMVRPIKDLKERADREQLLAEEAEAELDGFGRFHGGRDRHLLEQRVAKHNREHAGAAKRLAKLEARERELRESGRHPDAWFEAEGEALALGSAAQRELAERYELERTVAADDAARVDAGPQGPERDPAAGADQGVDIGG